MPSPSVSTFSFPSTTEPVFSASTSEPVFESPNHSQTSQITQSQQLQQYHTTNVSNNNAKFPYLKKEEYETWAMKMEYWIMNSDHNLWNIVLNENSRKKIGRYPKGNIRILLRVSSLPEDHMADFHHLDDARDIWLAVKARFGGNDESKKMRKSMLKQEFSEFRVSESEGLHKGYDKFQKILSQLNQMQAKPDNEDCNMKFLRALPPSWSQVAITLKTKGGLDYLSFDDLYNKLRTLEIDVKGGSSYDSRGTSAPTHSAFISAASTNSKMSYPDQSHSTTFTSASSSPAASSNVIENVLHSFVAESDPQQQITYEDFDQIGKLDLEELDIKWQMAMLSVRINRFEKKAGRKMKFNNKDAARFDKKKVKCYKCSELGHFARECTGKQLDSKARYSSFKLKELDKSEEPKALLSVDSMLNWSDHEGEDVENGAAQVYGMIAGAEEDAAGSATGNATGDVADDVSNAAAEFALMGISSQVQTCPFGCEHLYAELKKEFDNVEAQYKECYIQVQAYKSTLQTLEQQKGWYQSNQLALEERIRILTANLENTTNMLKYTENLNEQAKLEKLNDKVKLEESKARLFGSDEVFDLSAPSIFDSSPKDVAEKPLYDRFVKTVGMHAVPPPITRTFMPPPTSLTLMIHRLPMWNKSSDSETTGFASCVSSVKSSSFKTNEPLASTPSSVDFKTVSETADQQPSFHNDDSSFSFKENVKPPRNLCNKSGINSRSLCKRKYFGSKTCFVCGSKFHLIKDCDFYEKQLELHNKPMWNNVANIPSFVPKAASVPAGSRNRPTSVPAGRPFSAGKMGELLLSPQQVVLGEFKGQICNGDPRTMVDLINLHGGTVTFGGGDGKITGKGTIRTSKLNFENVYYVEELQNFNLFSVSQICDTKNKVLFTDKECLVLSKEFQLPENSQVVLRVPRRNNLYCFNLSDIQPERDVTCLLAKASLDESTKWHRRMAHVNFKNMNKLAKHGLVNGLPSKIFTNEHNCVACNKGKQHKASYKAITAVSTISAPLQLLHMDLFGPTSIRSIDHKYYSLVVTDDFSRFTWVFFLGTKDETYGILKDFITFIENQLTKKVKAIRCDNGTEFKNSKLIELCGSKGIKRDYSNARTPQQNGVAERKNRTLIEAARTMLADSKLPTMFWTEAVSTACYVLNRVLVTKPHNKTPYELVSGKVPNISHLKPFGCLVTILNTSDHLGKFEGKADEGLLLVYAAHSYTRFKTNQPAGTQDTNIHAGTQDDSDSECDEQVIVVPSFPSNSFSGPKVHDASEMVESSSDYAEELARLQKQAYEANATAEKHLSQADLAASRNRVPAGKIDSAAGVSYGPTETSTPVFKPVHTDATSLPPGHSLGSSEHSTRYPSPSDLANSMSSSSEMEDIHHHPDTGIFSSSSYDDDFGGTVTNLAPSIVVDSVLTKRVNTIHPQSQILGDLTSPVQTRGTLKKSKFGASAFVSYVHDQQRNNHTDYLHSMQEEMQQFINQKVWQLVPLPDGKIAIGTKWILKNKRDARGIVVRNKARLVAQGHRQEEGIDYDEVFALVARIEALGYPRFALYMGIYGISMILFTEVVKALVWSSSAPGRLQVKQKPDGSFISQDQVCPGMLRNLIMESISMIGSLMYLTASRLLSVLLAKSKNNCGYSSNERNMFAAANVVVRFIILVVHIGMLNSLDAMANGGFEFKGEDCFFLLVALLVPTGRTIPTGLHKHSTDILVIIKSIAALMSVRAQQGGFLGETKRQCRLSHSSGPRPLLELLKEGPPAILATIDRTPYTITESLVRSQLQLDDDGGVKDLSIADIYLGDHMPLLATMLPPAQAAITGESSREAAPSNPQTVPKTITKPDHSHDHESIPPRLTTVF
ncbi:putative ribonuclease H-like domain-containing protein [Tanacetum coccineum]